MAAAPIISSLASKIFGCIITLPLIFLALGKVFPKHPLYGEMVKGFPEHHCVVWGVPPSLGNLWRILIGVTELASVVFMHLMWLESTAGYVLSVIGPMLWVGITLGGTFTHVLCRDPMPAIPFCGTVCFLNVVQLILRLLYTGPLLDPAYFYTPAIIVAGFLWLAFFGHLLKGRTDWESQAALSSKEGAGEGTGVEYPSSEARQA